MADTFTFSSGITVGVRRVSPFLVREVERIYPAPEPPTQTVELDGETKIEANPSDPDYLVRLFEHRSMVMEKKMDYLVRHGVVLADENAAREALTQVRAQWLAEFGQELPQGDFLMDYLRYVCIGTGDDLNDLVHAITERSAPTESGVTAAAKSFPGHVSGT